MTYRITIRDRAKYRQASAVAESLVGVEPENHYPCTVFVVDQSVFLRFCQMLATRRIDHFVEGPEPDPYAAVDRRYTMAGLVNSVPSTGIEYGEET